MSVAIYGLGYIGLPTAALIASSETNVIGVDNNKNIIKNINEGKVINFEANLEQTVHKALVSGYLAVTHEPSSADIYVITVPTPVVENNLPDLSYVKEVTKTIAPMLVKGNMVIIESTLPVGGTEKMINWILEERDDLNIPTNSSKDINDTDIHIAYCPERVLPGNILNELISNDRIIGGLSTECANRAQIFYKQFVQNCFASLPRQALHAVQLSLIHPKNNEVMSFESLLPEDMSNVIDRWRMYVKNNLN